MNNIKFIKEEDKMVYNPTRQIDTFYQICRYKNPKTNLHQTRKTIFNEKGKIIQTFEREYDTHFIKKFLRKVKVNKCQLFPCNLISMVALPNKANMTNVQSSLINDDTQYENFGAALK